MSILIVMFKHPQQPIYYYPEKTSSKRVFEKQNGRFFPEKQNGCFFKQQDGRRYEPEDSGAGADGARTEDDVILLELSDGCFLD